MSSRALRKLQREQEQKKQLEQKQDTLSEEEEDEADERDAPAKKPFNAFDMLTEGGDQDADSEEVELSDGKAPPATQKASSRSNGTPASATPKPKSKAKKKKSKKGKAAKAGHGYGTTKESDTAKSKEEKDEIDEALESLAIKSRDGSYTISSSKPDESFVQLCRTLEVESKHLNALNEMKRLFGNIMTEDDSPEPARRRGRGPTHIDLGGALTARYSPVSRGQGLAGLSLRRNVFMMGKEEWPKATSGGLGMELEQKGNDGTKYYRFVHNTAYQDVQRQFQSCVESMDPQRIIQLLQFNPYHISTVLQVSEIAKQQGDHSVSGDLLERALFSFGRCVHSSFSTALAEGKARLDFRRPENREFWLAAWRYIANLGQRGTWRTAYEWAKLLLAMDPESDPYCVLMIIDQLALRGGQAEHFLGSNWASLITDRTVPDPGPNMRISIALAEHKLKKADRSRATLSQAVRDFPWIFAHLFKELNIERVPKSVWGKEPRSEQEALESACYVHRAKDLWNTPDAISFLVEVVETTDVPPNPPISNAAVNLTEARHALLSGMPQLIGLIPRHYTTMSSSSSDPLPPSDNLESYTTTLPSTRRMPVSAYHGPLDSDNDSSDAEELAPPRRRAQTPPPAPTNGETNEEDPDPAFERGIRGFFSRFLAWPNPNGGRPPQQEQQLPATANVNADRGLNFDRQIDELVQRATAEEAASEAEAEAASSSPLPSPEPEEAYDEDANKRWLAGRGMMQLKEFVEAHGTEMGAWGGAEAEGRAKLAEYARRVGLLRETNRRFILDYALRQGAGGVVRDLVVGFMG